MNGKELLIHTGKISRLLTINNNLTAETSTSKDKKVTLV